MDIEQGEGIKADFPYIPTKLIYISVTICPKVITAAVEGYICNAFSRD